MPVEKVDESGTRDKHKAICRDSFRALVLRLFLLIRRSSYYYQKKKNEERFYIRSQFDRAH